MNAHKRSSLTAWITRCIHCRLVEGVAFLAILCVLPYSCSQSNLAHINKGGTTDSVSSLSTDRARVPLDQIGSAPQFPKAAKSQSTPAAPDARAERQLERARKRFDEENWADALAALEKAIQIDPALNEARILHARASIRLGGVSAAREQIDEVLARDPRNVAAHWLLGELAVRDRKPDEAIAEFRLALLASDVASPRPETVLTRLSLAQLLQQEGYLAAAAEQFEAYLIAARSPSVEMNGHGELREAMRLFRSKAPVFLGDIYTTLNDPPKALAAFELALKDRPDDKILQKKRIIALAKAGRADDALAAARAWSAETGQSGGLELLREVCDLVGRPEQYDAELLSLASNTVDFRTTLSLASLLMERKKFAEANDLLTNAAGKEEPPPKVFIMLAELSVLRADAGCAYRALVGVIKSAPEEVDRIFKVVSDQAIAAEFRAFAERKSADKPDDAVARLVLARLLAADGKHLAAADQLREAIKLDAKLGPAYAALAESLRAAKKWEDAIKAAEEANELGVKSVTVYLAKADAHAALDQDEAAETAYLAAFEADKTSGEPLFRLAELASRRGQQRRCEQLYRRILDDVEPRHMKARERLVIHYLNRGDIEKCREYFGDFAALNLAGPSEARCRAMLALTTSTATTPQGRLDEYLAALNEILKQYPDDADTHIEIARSHGAVNHYEDALVAIDRAVALAPDDPAARELKAGLLAKLLRFHEAAAVVRGLLVDRPRDLGYLQDLLRFADSEGDWDTAAALLREFLSRDDLKAQHAAFTSMLVNALIHSDRFDEAVEASKKWLEQSPDDILRRGTYLAALGRAKRHNEAIALAKSYLDKEPGNRVTQMTLLQRLQEARRFTEALQYTLAWLGDAPDDVDLNMALIRLCWSAKNWDQAIEIARTNAERSDSRTSFEALLGETYRFARRYDEAIELYKGRVAKWQKRRQDLEGALRRAADPRKERDTLVGLRECITEAKLANYALINSLISAERYDRAERAINRLLTPELEAREAGREFDQDLVVDMRNMLSEIYQDTDRLGQSIQQLEEIYKLDTEDPGINNNFGYTLVDSGIDLDRGEKMIRFSLAQNPKSHASLDSLGWALYKRGKFDDAVSYLRQSLRIADGEEPVLHDHLADALYRKGDRAAAELEWKKALEMCAPEHDPPPDRDRRILYKSLKKKIDALKKGDEVETAPIGGTTSQPAESPKTDR